MKDHRQKFYLADVARPILGANFFTANNIAIDLRGRRLVDLNHGHIFAALTEPPIDFRQLANDQAVSQEIAAYRTSITNLLLQDIPFGDVSLLCDMSLGKPRPVLPKEWTYKVFQAIHSLAHAGPRPTQRAIADRYVWHGLKRDIRRWCRECQSCQAAKMHRQTLSSYGAEKTKRH